jgi:alpha-L-fucosidase
VYEGTWESVRTHAVPDWYEDAKLGVFLHWGLYSVPGWAPQVPDIQELLVSRGPRTLLRQNPYAEWYRNTMRIRGSPTQRHHNEVYGDDYPYDNFVRIFDEASGRANVDAIAELCEAAGARYAVLTTKHHEGFCLWPSRVPHPVKGEYHAARDLVGDLTSAVRARGLRMGLYYSGGYDWPYSGSVLRSPAHAVLAVPHDRRYAEFATAHVRELIDRYEPSVLWNDIAWPAAGDVPELFAYYYNTVPDGVVNDRWLQARMPRNFISDGLMLAAGNVVQALWRFLPEDRKRLTFAPPPHCDFRTPEYAVVHTTSERKWELARGVGHSFGANRAERPEDIIGEAELIQLFVDVVSKNGNLLIGVGPRPDGTIPDSQQAPLRALGAWLAVNGEAVYASRPWMLAASTTADGVPVRFTLSGGAVYALVFGVPSARRIHLRAIDASRVRRVRLVGVEDPLEWLDDNGELSVTVPERLPVSAVTVLDLGEGVRARVGQPS